MFVSPTSTLKGRPGNSILFSSIFLPFSYFAKIISLKADMNICTTAAKGKKVLKIPKRLF